ncbi:MAG: MFS transporter [Chloroflexia bacterium]
MATGSNTTTDLRRTTFVGYGAFLLLGWNGVIIPVLILSLQQEFRLSNADFSVLYLIAPLSYAAGSFGGGMLSERFGRRPILAGAAALLSVGVSAAVLTPTWTTFIVAMLLWAAGAGALDGGMNGLFLAIYARARGGALNRLHLFFSIGALTAPLVVGRLLVAGVSWRTVLLGIAAAAATLGVLLAVHRLPLERCVAGAAGSTSRSRRRGEVAAAVCGACGRDLLLRCGGVGGRGWLVAFLSESSLGVATSALSLFWGGMAVGRLLSSWAADRFAPTAFAVGGIALFSASIVGAVLAPNLWLSVALFGAAGLFSGPIHPMILAVGGDLYPNRLSAFSGALGAAGILGSLTYAPLVGFASSRVGLGAGILGAGLLGIPAAAAVLAATVVARREGGETHRRPLSNRPQ